MPTLKQQQSLVTKAKQQLSDFMAFETALKDAITVYNTSDKSSAAIVALSKASNDYLVNKQKYPEISCFRPAPFLDTALKNLDKQKILVETLYRSVLTMITAAEAAIESAAIERAAIEKAAAKIAEIHERMLSLLDEYARREAHSERIDNQVYFQNHPEVYHEYILSTQSILIRGLAEIKSALPKESVEYDDNQALQSQLEGCLTQIDAKIQQAILAEMRCAQSQPSKAPSTSGKSDGELLLDDKEALLSAVRSIAEEGNHPLAVQVVTQETNTLLATNGSNISRYNQLSHFLKELPVPSLQRLGKLMLALSAAFTILAISTLPAVIVPGVAGLLALTFGVAGSKCMFFSPKPPPKSVSESSDALTAATL